MFRRKYFVYGVRDKQKVLLPLQNVDVKTELRGATANTIVEMTYINANCDIPLECTYTFPIEKNTVLANFEATIDDRVI